MKTLVIIMAKKRMIMRTIFVIPQIVFLIGLLSVKNGNKIFCKWKNKNFENYIGYIPPFCNQQTHEWSKWFNLDDPRYYIN